MSFRSSKPRVSRGESIFDGSIRNSGLPNMRNSIFNSPLTQPTQPEVHDDVTFYVADDNDEEDIQNKQISPQLKQSDKPEIVTQEVLASHLLEIQRLKITLLRIQGRLHSQDELILGVRQNLLRRMVQYLNTVKSTPRSEADNKSIAEVKSDLDDILKEQQILIVSLRQDKLKQLVELNPKIDSNKSHFQQPKLTRQLSKSAESGLDVVESTITRRISRKPLLPRVAKLQRSETARAERSLYFSELAKKTGNVLKRNKSLLGHKRRKSVDDIYASISDVHLSRTSYADSELKPNQQFLKLNESGQLVFHSKENNPNSTNKVAVPTRQQTPDILAHRNKSDAKSKETPTKSENKSDKFRTESSQWKSCAAALPPRHNQQKLMRNSNKIPERKSKNTAHHAEAKKTGNTRITTDKCHTDGNPMLSSEEDFVDVDDLVHFMQNHKPPATPFVRGYNAVNSASFREPPTFAVENAQSELPGICRDRITICHSPQFHRVDKNVSQGKPRLDFGNSSKTKSNVAAATKVHPGNVSTPESTNKPSHRASLQINLCETSRDAAKKPSDAPSYQHSKHIPTQPYSNTDKPSELNNTDNRLNTMVDRANGNSTSSLDLHDDDVEFASTAMILSQITPNTSATENKNIQAMFNNLSKQATSPTGAAPTMDYVNNAYVLSNNLAHEATNRADAAAQQVSQLSPESPIFQSFREFSKQLDLIQVSTSSKLSGADAQAGPNDVVSGSKTHIIVPRGTAPTIENKPLLLKKPRRKTLKSKRKLSQSLTDLTEQNSDEVVRRKPKNKFGVRPVSCIHDYANIYDVPKSIPLYTNVGNIAVDIIRHAAPGLGNVGNLEQHTVGQTTTGVGNVRSIAQDTTRQPTPATTNAQTPQYVNLKDIKLQSDHSRLSTHQNQSANQINFQKKQINIPPPKSKKSHFPQGQISNASSTDSVFDTTNDIIISKRTSPERSVLRRSVSDDVIYEQDKKRIHEDLRRLVELHDEVKETENIVNALWRPLQREMEANRGDVKPKRSTLPRAMAPNFGKKFKCIVM